jgi:acyl dehydratase
MDTRELDSLPALPPSYGKAAFGILPVGGGSDEPPDHALGVDSVEIDADAVAGYARVCGFTLGRWLPPTYPHILGFPLSMSLMTEREFPFPLLGLVHTANEIDQREPIALDAKPRLRVWAEDLRPHHKGRQIDLVTEASVGGEVVWLEHSTYLRPGKGEGERPDRGEDPLAGVEPSAVWDVPGDIGRRYAGVSGDRNPIHLHGLSARLFGFPSAIAHGMWTYAKALSSLGGQLTERHVSRVEFRAPLRIPGRAQLLTKRSGNGWLLGLDSPDGEHRHLELRVNE